MDVKPYERYPLELDIEFRKDYAREQFEGTLKNISLSGAFLENSMDSLKTQDRISLSLNLSGRERHITATVVWKNQRGCGLKFSTFSNQDVQIIDDLIYFLESKRETKKDVLADIFKKLS